MTGSCQRRQQLKLDHGRRGTRSCTINYEFPTPRRLDYVPNRRDTAIDIPVSSFGFGGTNFGPSCSRYEHLSSCCQLPACGCRLN